MHIEKNHWQIIWEMFFSEGNKQNENQTKKMKSTYPSTVY